MFGIYSAFWQSFFSIVLISLIGSFANAQTTFSYHGRVFDQTRETPISGTADFNLKVMAHQKCILFSENQKDVSLSEFGVFSLEVGISQKKASPTISKGRFDSGISLAQAFRFVKASELNSECETDITPMDTRYLVVEITAYAADIILGPFILLLATVAFDVMHYLLHVMAGSRFRLIKAVGNLHTVHHRFLDEDLVIHDDLIKANMWCHVIG